MVAHFRFRQNRQAHIIISLHKYIRHKPFFITVRTTTINMMKSMIQFNNSSKLVVPVSSSTTEALHDAKTKNQNDTSTDITDDETELSSSMSSSSDSSNTSVNSPISSSSSSSEEEVDERLQDLIDDNKWQEVDILWDVDEDDDEEDDDCSSDDDDSECSSVEPSNNDGDDYYSLSSDDESSVVGEEIIAYGDGCKWQEVNLWEDDEDEEVVQRHNEKEEGTCTECEYIGMWIEFDLRTSTEEEDDDNISNL